MSGRGSSAQEILEKVIIGLIRHFWFGPSPERQPAASLWCPKRSLHLHSQYIDGALKSLTSPRSSRRRSA